MGKLVEVYQASGEMEALVIKGLLASQGIPSYVRCNAAPSVHVFTVDGLGRVTILVAESDAEEARQLISNRQEDVHPPSNDAA